MDSFHYTNQIRLLTGAYAGDGEVNVRGSYPGPGLGIAHDVGDADAGVARALDVQRHAGRARGVGSRSELPSSLIAEATSSAVRAAASSSGMPGPR